LDECGSAMRSTSPMYVCTPVGSTVCLRLLNFVCKGMRRSCNACSPPAPPGQTPRAHPPCSNAPRVSQIYLFVFEVDNFFVAHMGGISFPIHCSFRSDGVLVLQRLPERRCSVAIGAMLG
jgi:hypothetical protein